MQQDHQHIDRKLRELESQSLPDLSKIDEHWQQLKINLQPVNSNGPARVPRKYGWWIVAAAAIISILFIAIYTANDRDGENDSIAVVPDSNDDQIATDTIPASGKMDTLPASPGKKHRKPSTAVAHVTSKKHTAPKDSTVASRKKNPVKRIYAAPQLKNDSLTPKKKSPTKSKQKVITEVSTLKSNIRSTDATTTKVNIDTEFLSNAARLEEFFRQLEKEVQEFVIDNNRDTLLIGKEGTALLIPANSFNSSNTKISIQLKEYYSYQDIITNRLNTTSNGEQLVTGGMIYLQAITDNREVSLNDGKSIKWFLPDTTSATMSNMRIFNAVLTPNQNSGSYREGMTPASYQNMDSVSGNASTSSLNWVPGGEGFASRGGDVYIKILNLQDNPSLITLEKDYSYNTAKFLVAKSCPLSNTEVKEELNKRYGHNYQKIKVRRLWWGDRKKFLFSSNSYKSVIGDSILISFNEAIRMSYISKADSIRLVENLSPVSRFFFTNKDQLVKKYSLDILTLGWINCDRLNNDPRPKIGYYVDLGDSASNYHTMLVFDKFKSVMNGYMVGNKVMFPNVPEGESARLISVGIKNGKPVSAMKAVQISRSTLNNLNFEETSPQYFKEKAGIIAN